MRGREFASRDCATAMVGAAPAGRRRSKARRKGSHIGCVAIPSVVSSDYCRAGKSRNQFPALSSVTQGGFRKSILRSSRRVCDRSRFAIRRLLACLGAALYKGFFPARGSPIPRARRRSRRSSATLSSASSPAASRPSAMSRSGRAAYRRCPCAPRCHATASSA